MTVRGTASKDGAHRTRPGEIAWKHHPRGSILATRQSTQLLVARQSGPVSNCVAVLPDEFLQARVLPASSTSSASTKRIWDPVATRNPRLRAWTLRREVREEPSHVDLRASPATLRRELNCHHRRRSVEFAVALGKHALDTLPQPVGLGAPHRHDKADQLALSDSLECLEHDRVTSLLRA